MIAFKTDCRTARMEPKTAVMAWMREEMREPSWSPRDGMVVANVVDVDL